MAFGDYQNEVYFGGLTGKVPDQPFTFAELERRAEELMPPNTWSYVAGGAGDELTQRTNATAFQQWGLVPRMLRGVAERDLSVNLFGMELDSPLLLAPVGVVGICEPEEHGDIKVARAAARTGVPMIASSLTCDPMEDVAAELGDTPGLFQLYFPNDREVAESLVRRAETAGFKAIVLTLDTWILGWRPRDLSIAHFPQLRGKCLANYTSDPVFRSRLDESPEENPMLAAGTWAQMFGFAMTWEDLAWLRSITDLPLLVKGISNAEDTRKAIDYGVNGIYCSNHGGRQANGGIPALYTLPEVVDAAGDVPVLFDSGVRSGTDVVKALALGATAVGIGRPYVYGLTVGGEDGVVHLIRSFQAEADLLMAVNGYGSIADLRSPDAIRKL
ncbi:lactate 2-monooxygenase [Pseudonocardiaceae bacterium YIM PH 21723]|nr:lactate 2-monooxygenase [Pseudonocardiaceae bacterium YIM PH 21723]